MKRRIWLFAAAVLFLLVAVLSWLDDSARPAAPPHVEFRRYPTVEERAVMEKRRTLAPLPPPADDPEVETENRDPLLVALPKSAGTAFVLEAEAFFGMPIGRMLARCLEQDSDAIENSELDPKRVERVAFARTGPDRQIAAISGKFPERELVGMTRDGGEAYGDKAVLLRPLKAGASAGKTVAVWDDQLLLTGDSPEDVRAAIDRLEGRALGESAIDGNEAYGEAYGRLGVEALADLLPAELQDKLVKAGLSVDFHVDASEDALLTLDATGDPDTARDIGQTLAALLAAKRVEAVADGDRDLARLLDLYAVRLNDDGFELEAAFPVDFVREALGKCASDRADAGVDED